jgi:hypothetical protein
MPGVNCTVVEIWLACLLAANTPVHIKKKVQNMHKMIVESRIVLLSIIFPSY